MEFPGEIPISRFGERFQTQLVTIITAFEHSTKEGIIHKSYNLGPFYRSGLSYNDIIIDEILWASKVTIK